MPKEAGPFTGTGPVFLTWAVAGLVGTASLGLSSPLLSPWVAGTFEPWVAREILRAGFAASSVLVLAAFYTTVAIHELGHAVAGLATEFQVRSVRVGPFVVRPGLRLSVHPSPQAWINGVAELVAGRTRSLARRSLIMVACGPLANVLTAVSILLWNSTWSMYEAALVAFSLAVAASDLVPFEGPAGASDGRRMWMLMRGTVPGQRWVALLELNCRLAAGEPPETLPRQLVAAATTLSDESADTVAANAIAFAAAFDGGRDDEAAGRLELCLRYSNRASLPVREALMSDASVFQGRRRRRPGLAAAWLEAIPVSARTRWLRLRGEAAVLEASGNRVEALAKLHLARNELGQTSPPQRIALHRLDQWIAELDAKLRSE